MAVLSFSEDAFGVDTGEGSTLTAKPVEGEFPKVASIITENTEAVEHIRFNPAFLTNLCKMPRAGKNDPVQLTFDGNRKPMRSEWSVDDVKYTYLLMPVRERS